MNIINWAYFNLIFFGVLVVVLLLVGWLLYMEWRMFQTQKRLKSFFKGKKADDLEGIMYEQIKRLRQQEKDIKELNQSSRDLWKMASRGIQKVGVVRFNPFGDTGGNQSFVVALLDDSDNGLTISSFFGREGNRLYAKPIQKGKSKYPLMEEEKEALKVAQNEK